MKADPGFCMRHLATDEYITEFANLVYASLDTVALPETIQWIRNQAEVASEHGVDLIAYEGGQHLAALPGVWDNSAINQLFDEFNRDERMGQTLSQSSRSLAKLRWQAFRSFQQSQNL